MYLNHYQDMQMHYKCECGDDLSHASKPFNLVDIGATTCTVEVACAKCNTKTTIVFGSPIHSAQEALRPHELGRFSLPNGR